MPATSKTASPVSPNWTRRQTLAALHIYFQLPFGQLHSKQPKIKQLADWIDRSANSVALKLVNIASLDPQIIASGRKGMGNASSLDKYLACLPDCWPSSFPILSDAFLSFRDHTVCTKYQQVDEWSSASYLPADFVFEMYVKKPQYWSRDHYEVLPV